MSATGRGPYPYGPRVRGLDEVMGRVYLSRGEHGEPAVLQVPTGRSTARQMAPVQVLVTAFGEEGGVAVAVQGEPPPQGVATDVVRDALEAGADLLDALEHRPAVARHLARLRPRARTGPTRTLRRWAPTLAVAAGVVSLVWPDATVNVRVQEPELPAYAWEVPATTANVAYTDILHGSSTPKPWSVGQRIIVPNGPMEGQDTPPCQSPATALKGGCWIKLAASPPCPKNSAEDKDVGGCWVPVRGQKPMPVSIDREHGR